MNQSTRDSFGEALLELGAINPKIAVVTGNLGSSIRATAFAKAYPRRFFDVGVAEQNMIGFSAGLALDGYTVFALSYACFSPTINFNTIRQSVCLNQANVKIVGSHAGLANSYYGFTHQGLEDLALARTLPNLIVLSPLDAKETKLLTYQAAQTEGPVYLRLTNPPTPLWPQADFSHPLLQKGQDLTILGTGPILTQVLSVLKKLPQTSVEIINVSSLEPYPIEIVASSVKKTKRLLTIEDHNLNGGLGELTLRHLAEENITDFRSILMGVTDLITHTAPNHQKIWSHYGLGPTNIQKKITHLLSL